MTILSFEKNNKKQLNKVITIVSIIFITPHNMDLRLPTSLAVIFGSFTLVSTTLLEQHSLVGIASERSIANLSAMKLFTQSLTNLYPNENFAAARVHLGSLCRNSGPNAHGSHRFITRQ